MLPATNAGRLLLAIVAAAALLIAAAPTIEPFNSSYAKTRKRMHMHRFFMCSP
jgi:hypothetical protein